MGGGRVKKPHAKLRYKHDKRKPMPLPLYVVDAFADRAFAGNPAAVCLFDRYPSDQWLQLLGREMNLSETACLVRHSQSEFELRWFTPSVEVSLCGHATLASA